MDVFLVPTGAERYDLYCEIDEAAPDASVQPQGVFRRLKHAFRVMLAEAERERRHGGATDRAGWLARTKARTLRWVAESIAEQRLLWHLRREPSACLFHPTDIDSMAARDLLRKQLGRDFDRHRWWLTIDSLGLIASGLLVLVPGPNVIGYYFAFRVVGHYLSVRGARNGLDRVEWRYEPSGPLSRLRESLALDGDGRRMVASEVATALGLEHFERFFARAAIKD